MSVSISRKEAEDLRPYIDKTVTTYLGFNDGEVVSLAVNCLSDGYDKDTTLMKLEKVLMDEQKAQKLTDRIYELVHQAQASLKATKRVKEEPTDGPDLKRSRSRFTSDNGDSDSVASTPNVAPPPAPTPSPGQLSADKIKEMMANAQRMIEERKKALAASGINLNPPTVPSMPPPVVLPPPTVIIPEITPQAAANSSLAPRAPFAGPVIPATVVDDKAKRISDLQAQIAAKLANSGVTNLGSNLPKLPTSGISPLIPPIDVELPKGKPAPLILDDKGRTVDLTGKEVQLPQHTPTLKANIRAKKKEEFRVQTHEKPSQAADETPESRFFDGRVMAKGIQRPKRGFNFHEQGKFVQMATRLRMKAQLERLQSEIHQIARKTGIDSATKLALIAPRIDKQEDDEGPEVEWWDTVILKSRNYQNEGEEPDLRYEAITNLIEHPIKLRAPTDPLKIPFLPVFLTAKERKKLRRTNRREAYKETQEKIRLGLIAPPQPKVRISNLMRVLGTEAVQDPTKIEAHVREQMAKRLAAHKQANAERKLTAEQQRQKKIRKIKEDTSLQIHVAVYRLKDLSHPSKKFKVETNAKQLMMTGCAVLFKDINVVVVEGGPKQQKKFKRLMLNRIKWEEEPIKGREGPDAVNSCVLVWEGTTKQRNFGEVIFKLCPTESFAREHFRKHGVEHYWDLAYSGAVLDKDADE